jgi:hypothetical protein
MRVSVGTKVTQPLPNGLRWPAVAITDEVAETVTVINRSTGLPVDIKVTRADFISLRETREGAKYLALTTEVVQYGYRPVAEPRLSNVVGLDFEEDGTQIDGQTLIERHGATYSEWQAGQFEARRGATNAADL